MLVHDEGDRDAGGAQLAGEVDGVLEFGRLVARVEIFSEKTRLTPAGVQGVELGVEGLAGGGGAGVADPHMPGRLRAGVPAGAAVRPTTDPGLRSAGVGDGERLGQ